MASGLTFIPMWTGGKSACNVGAKSGNDNGNGRLPTCIIATTCNENKSNIKDNH